MWFLPSITTSSQLEKKKKKREDASIEGDNKIEMNTCSQFYLVQRLP